MTITTDGLRLCRMRETMHGHGDKGMWMYGYTCIQHPRLQRIDRCPRRGAPVESKFRVDGKDVGATLDEAVAALNQPHDLAGLPGRLAEQMVGRVTVVLQDGVLIATGESPTRCVRLAQSAPAYEGVPIQWVPGAEGSA